MNFKRTVSLLIAGFLFGACVPKEYVKQNAVLIIFKTPAFKYADMGFIYENEDETKVDIYSSGQSLMTLNITKSSVCMSLFECMSKISFNRKVLNSMYPENIVENIFRGKQIFNGESLEKNRNGFTQNIIKQGKYNIDYSVLNNEVIFRDTINAIFIKIKKQ